MRHWQQLAQSARLAHTARRALLRLFPVEMAALAIAPGSKTKQAAPHAHLASGVHPGRDMSAGWATTAHWAAPRPANALLDTWAPEPASTAPTVGARAPRATTVHLARLRPCRALRARTAAGKAWAAVTSAMAAPPAPCVRRQPSITLSAARVVCSPSRTKARARHVSQAN